MTCISSALLVGGGIGGLATAISLSRIGVQCDLVDNGDPTQGASIAFSGRAADALFDLGIYDLAHEAGTPFSPNDVAAAGMRDSAGRLLSPGPKFAAGRDIVAIFRPTLIGLMTTIAKELGVRIRHGTTFSKVDNRVDGVTVTFTDGERRDYDLLVGSDGINSATREAFFPDSPKPVYTGQISIRWLAPGPRVQEESWYASSIGRLGFYYLPEDIVYVPSVINVPENKHMNKKEVLDLFTELLDSFTAPAVVELRSRLTPDAKLIARPFEWLLVPEPWYRTRVVLIGDAAHATTAHMGMGGGMALEDAVVLAQCVSSAGTVQEALDNFMARRFKRVETVVSTSVRISELQQQSAPPAERMALLSKGFAALASPY